MIDLNRDLPRLPLHFTETHDLALRFPSPLSELSSVPALQVSAAKPVPKAVGNVLFVPASWAGSSSPAAQYSPWLWPRK